MDNQQQSPNPQAQIPQAHQTPPAQKSSKTGLWIFLTTLLTAIIVGGGAYIWFQGELCSYIFHVRHKETSDTTCINVYEKNVWAWRDGLKLDIFKIQTKEVANIWK